jgi:hypothetical protein
MNDPDRSPRPAEELISALASDLAPVSAPGSALWPSALAAVVGLGASALVFAPWLGLRPDLAAHFARRGFVLLGIGLFFSSFLGLLSAQTLALPGRSTLRRLLALAFSLPLAIGAALSTRLILHRLSFDLTRPSPSLRLSEAGCTEAILALSLLPALFFFALLRRRAPTHPEWTGAIAGTSAISLASAALLLHCPNDAPLHLLAWHLIAPLAAACALGALAGRRWLRW